MTIKIGINGFGRIGRTILRASLKPEYRDFKFVHINDIVDTATLAHLLKYDSVHGTLPNVSATKTGLSVNDQDISVSAIRSPAEIPWKEKGVDLVMECSGFFKNREDYMGHIKAGAPKVLISAPAK